MRDNAAAAQWLRLCVYSGRPLRGCASLWRWAAFRHNIHSTSSKREPPMNDDLLSLLPQTEFTRRRFVVTSLAAGFALAVQPVTAQTITTDTNGIVAGE